MTATRLAAGLPTLAELGDRNGSAGHAQDGDRPLITVAARRVRDKFPASATQTERALWSRNADSWRSWVDWRELLPARSGQRSRQYFGCCWSARSRLAGRGAALHSISLRGRDCTRPSDLRLSSAGSSNAARGRSRSSFRRESVGEGPSYSACSGSGASCSRPNSCGQSDEVRVRPAW